MFPRSLFPPGNACWKGQRPASHSTLSSLSLSTPPRLFFSFAGPGGIVVVQTAEAKTVRADQIFDMSETLHLTAASAAIDAPLGSTVSVPLAAVDGPNKVMFPCDMFVMYPSSSGEAVVEDDEDSSLPRLGTLQVVSYGGTPLLLDVRRGEESERESGVEGVHEEGILGGNSGQHQDEGTPTNSTLLSIQLVGVVLMGCSGDRNGSGGNDGSKCCFVLPHGCGARANVAFLGGHLVALQAIKSGERLVTNCNLLVHNPSAVQSLSCKEVDGSEDRCFAGFNGMTPGDRRRLLPLAAEEVRVADAETHGVWSESTLLRVSPTSDMGHATFATQDISAGTVVIAPRAAFLLPFPTVYTLQLTSGRHMLFAGGGQCLAHSCDPTLRLQLGYDDGFKAIAVRDIKAGELLSFNYLTTEWAMDAPFDCMCGAGERPGAMCFGRIAGYKHLDPVSRSRLDGLAADTVLQRAALELTQSSVE